MNSITFAIAILAIALGVLSAVLVIVSLLRQRSGVVKGREAGRAALKRLAKDLHVSEERIRNASLIESRDRIVTHLYPDAQTPMGPDMRAIEEAREQFLFGDRGLGIGEVPMEVFALDEKVRQDVLAGLHVLRTLARSSDKEQAH